MAVILAIECFHIPRPALAASATQEAAIDKFMRQSMTDGPVPGMALAIVQDEKVSLAKGYGVTGDGKPFTCDTPIFIASLSKAMTATVALMLVADGRIDLDAPVLRYLPKFRINSPDGGKAITVRYLLNQTSGLTDGGFPEMRMAQPTSLAQRVVSLQSAVPLNAPGTSFHYFNSNYAIVARIVVVVSNQPFEAVLKEKLFEPLGMTNTVAISTYSQAQALSSPPINGHVAAYGRAWRWHEPGGFMGGHGGVVSTANDMRRWLKWQMTGQPNILPPDLRVLMQTPPPSSPYAMGWFAHSENGEKSIFHGGMFSTVSSDMAIYPDRQLGIVLLYGIGGPLPAATVLPKIRDGAFAIATGKPLPQSNASFKNIGRGAAIVTFVLAVLALLDLYSVRKWAQASPVVTWRSVAGVIVRLTPMAIFIPLPRLFQLFHGRAFNFEVTFFAMLDMTIGLLIVSSILAASAVWRMVVMAQISSRHRDVSTSTQT